jgi:hydrogenase expression/formation protein HypC
MCLAIPARVTRVDGSKAQVDFGEGVLRDVNVTLVDAKVGEYVLVHAGYAIQTVDEKEALETLALWKEILAVEKEQGS